MRHCLCCGGGGMATLKVQFNFYFSFCNLPGCRKRKPSKIRQSNGGLFRKEKCPWKSNRDSLFRQKKSAKVCHCQNFQEKSLPKDIHDRLFKTKSVKRRTFFAPGSIIILWESISNSFQMMLNICLLFTLLIKCYKKGLFSDYICNSLKNWTTNQFPTY